MNGYELPFSDFARRRPWRFNLVENVDALNRAIAREAVHAIRAAGRAGRSILIITPVGPLDYGYWARLCNEEEVSCGALIAIAMDEYLDERTGNYVDLPHPLSFRRFLHETFVNRLHLRLRPDPANICFPDPHEPEETTTLIESHGGADLCFGGCGLTGHFAFNDPPEPGGSGDENQVRNSRTRCVTIVRESQAQMCMGGTHGNWEIIPKRAVTLGMYELLMSRKIHLTFMRSWHAGVLRRVLFGPVTGRCPGSFVQEHPNVEMTLTKLAASLPVIDVAQATGEEADGATRPY
jgi:glucosamine-6-phosphate deaminase